VMVLSSSTSPWPRCAAHSGAFAHEELFETVEPLVPERTKLLDGRASGIQRLWIQLAPVQPPFMRWAEQIRLFEDTDVF